jgi:hypothetical protein
MRQTESLLASQALAHRLANVNSGLCGRGVTTRMEDKVRRSAMIALLVLLALGLAAPTALGQVGQGAKASGKAGELTVAWWQWALSKPEAENPLIGDYSGGPQCDGRPVTDVSGKKWFLGGSTAEDAVVRTCTAPVGTQFFFPVVNNLNNPFPGETEEELLQQVNERLDAQLAGADVEVTVDGRTVKEKRLVRATTGFFTAEVPEGGLLDPAGSYRLVAGGLWATLPPLPPGEHIVHVKISGASFDQDITYHLTVVKGKSARGR